MIHSCILIYFALSSVIYYNVAGLDESEIPCNKTTCTGERSQIEGKPRVFRILVDDDLQVFDTSMFMNRNTIQAKANATLTKAAFGALASCLLIFTIAVWPHSNSHIVKPESRLIAKDLVDYYWSYHQYLRIKCTQNLVADSLFIYITHISDRDHSAIKDEYLPLFRAKSSEVQSEYSDISIADELVRRYPDLPTLDAENRDQVNRIIGKFLTDKEIATLVSEIMKFDEIFYQVIMEKKGSLEERQDPAFLFKALHEHGHSDTLLSEYRLPPGVEPLCSALAERLEKRIQRMYKEGALKQESYTMGGHTGPLGYHPAGHSIYESMIEYYRS